MQLVDRKGAALRLREQMRSWRFYNHFRSDADAPGRQPQLGTYAPVLANDGSDFAAALQTIREIGDDEALDRAVDDAFPGARIEIRVGGGFRWAMRCHPRPSLHRPSVHRRITCGQC